MKPLIPTFMCAALLALLPPMAHAETYRCGKGVVVDGDTKADVIQRCGQPQSQETFCEPIAVRPQIDFNGNAVASPLQCENVDSWTYNPGAGSFITMMEFRRGKLTTITAGNRAN